MGMDCKEIKTYSDLICKVGKIEPLYDVTLTNLELVNGDLNTGDIIFRYFKVNDSNFLLEKTKELVFYDSQNKEYIWAITHNYTNWESYPVKTIISKTLRG